MHDRERKLILLLGGERSGKSALAEEIGRAAGGPVVFVATCVPGDDEMRARVAAHRVRRPATWRVVEEPLHLAAALRPHLSDARLTIIDCLTLWASNVLLAQKDAELEAAERQARDEIAALVELHAASRCSLVIVSNEVGLGLVPPNPLGRAYRDLLGTINQAVAAAADEVYFVIAGLPVEIKRLSAPGIP